MGLGVAAGFEWRVLLCGVRVIGVGVRVFIFWFLAGFVNVHLLQNPHKPLLPDIIAHLQRKPQNPQSLLLNLLQHLLNRLQLLNLYLDNFFKIDIISNLLFLFSI